MLYLILKEICRWLEKRWIKKNYMNNWNTNPDNHTQHAPGGGNIVWGRRKWIWLTMFSVWAIETNVTLNLKYLNPAFDDSRQISLLTWGPPRSVSACTSRWWLSLTQSIMQTLGWAEGLYIGSLLSGRAVTAVADTERSAQSWSTPHLKQHLMHVKVQCTTILLIWWIALHFIIFLQIENLALKIVILNTVLHYPIAHASHGLCHRLMGHPHLLIVSAFK